VEVSASKIKMSFFFVFIK